MWVAVWSMARAQQALGVPVPESPGPWMRGEQELCTTVKGKGRAFGSTDREVGEGVGFRCRRLEGRIDEICLVVADAARWPKAWPDDLSCVLGASVWKVTAVPAFAPVRSYGQTLWIRRPMGAAIAYTWTFPEGPLHEEGRAIRRDGQLWEGVTCAAAGDWLSLTVTPDALVDEGRCQFRARDVSVPLRIENVRL